MAVPNMRRTMRGWTTKRIGWLISQNIQDGEKNEFYIPITLDCNIQPMPEEQIKRNPEEYWSWEWFSIIDVSGNALTTDDAIIIDGVRYRIEKRANWKRSGFYKYEAVADYDYPIPELPEPDPNIVTFGGSTVFYNQEAVTYAGT